MVCDRGNDCEIVQAILLLLFAFRSEKIRNVSMLMLFDNIIKKVVTRRIVRSIYYNLYLSSLRLTLYPLRNVKKKKKKISQCDLQKQNKAKLFVCFIEVTNGHVL